MAAAFNLTTTPKSLTLEAGQSGTIVVVVSNRLGKPVMGRIDPQVTPASAASWVVPPPEPQQRYDADPAATHTFEFGIQVPADADAQAVQFRADVVDVLAPDDNFAQGETVAINVSREPAVVNGGPTIPWWVWVIVGVVLVGAGIGIYFAVRPSGVPNVVDLAEDEAARKLRQAGFDSVAVVDTLADAGEFHHVLRQAPEAESDLPSKEDTTAAIATIVVRREPTQVPDIAGDDPSLAIEALRQAALLVLEPDRVQRVGTSDQSLDGKIRSVDPAAGTTVPKGSGVRLTLWYHRSRPPCPPTQIRCFTALDPATMAKVNQMRVDRRGTELRVVPP